MSKWIDIIATVAPTLASALGGPLAGLAVGAIGSALGLDDATKESVANAISGAKPEDLLKIKTAEMDFKAKMAELEVDLERISAEDRNSARQREISTKDKMPGFLGVGVTAGFFGVLAFMLTQEVPSGSRDVLNIMLGSLGTAWIQVMAYYFGSSSGSERKTAIMAKMGVQS